MTKMGAEDFTVPDTPRHRWKHHTFAEKQAFIVEIERQVKAGRGVRPVARELGIAPGNYYRWVREAGRAPARPARKKPEQTRALAIRPPEVPAFRAVTVAVAAPEPATELVLVAPGGYRLEGLDVASAAALLKALA